jgi:8-amino-7-oxononanoate synthase
MSALDDYLSSLDAELASLREAGLLRRLRLPRGIDLVSNDYLGLAEHPHLRERMRAALAELPAGAGASRLLRGHHACFERLEEKLAQFCGSQAALFFASGWAANVGLLQAILGRDDLVLSDERNHASLIDGMRLSGARRVIHAHLDLQAVQAELQRPRQGRALIVTESVFSMEGDLAPLVDLVELAERHGALVVVDEAHATGLYGAKGAGRVEELGLRERVLATVHTGGKALGVGGGWVAGPAVLRELLVNRARTFLFSTAPMPVISAGLRAALEVIAREPQRRAEVHAKAALLRRALADVGVTASGQAPIVPVIVGDNAAAVALQEGLALAGFDARAVRPPTVPAGTARLRVTARYPVANAELLRFAAEVGRLLGARAA